MSRAVLREVQIELVLIHRWWHLCPIIPAARSFSQGKDRTMFGVGHLPQIIRQLLSVRAQMLVEELLHLPAYCRRLKEGTAVAAAGNAPEGDLRAGHL